jgi:hypothetical protein
MTLVNYAVWAAAAALGLWMLWDMLRTDRSYSEEFLTSSAEGEIIDAEVGETAARS